MEDVIEDNVVSVFDLEQPADKSDEPEKTQAAEDVAEPASFVVPDKFNGKSFEDVVESYVNLEKEHGRKANEVGELRKLTDEILKQQVAKPQVQEVQVEQPINDVGVEDFFDDPAIALDRALSQNPRLRQLEDRLAAEAQAKSHASLLELHPDADDVVASPEFQKWAQESPGRLKMLQDSHENLDVPLAADLLNVYKTTTQATTDDAITERDAIAQDGLKKAITEKGDVKATERKKIFKRDELIQLKIQNPNRYESMRPEIMKAYAEGRVR